MNDDRYQVEQIEQKLNDLYEKRIELIKAQKQTDYQRYFGHPSLQPESELQEINSEIDRLEKKESAEKDWTKSLFYSHTLRSWNFHYPPDQLGLYVFSLIGMGTVVKAYWKSWNIKKASEILKSGVVKSDMLSIHRHFSGLNNEDLQHVKIMQRIVKGKAFVGAGILIIAFVGFVQLKNKHKSIQ